MSSLKRVLWSANDPGGANAILPVVQELLSRGYECMGLLTGPARESAGRMGLTYTDAAEFNDEERNARIESFRPEVLLAGRSVGYSIDKRILEFLNKKGVPSVYVLDFWNDYWQRLSEEERDYRYLPSMICVMDDLARDEMIEEGVPPERVTVTGNPYFDHWTDGITADSEDRFEILFVSQPISTVEGGQYGFDEFTVLKALIQELESLPPEYRLVIRPHPKEDAAKFDAFLGERVRIADAATLEAALSSAGLVIGMFSPVLIQAAAAGKRVLSVQLGAIGRDPLPTNRAGLTRKAGTPAEVQDALEDYAAGRYKPAGLSVEALWPKGAAQRIIQIIERL